MKPVENPWSDAADTQVKPRERVKKPSLYRVLLLNDDFTPMEFVVEILETVFAKPTDEALAIMLRVHHHGVGVCGVFSFEIAETKMHQVLQHAKACGHPLQCTMEKL
jgi:ATP-dependent Clp protease adaptor protein ClpS